MGPSKDLAAAISPQTGHRVLKKLLKSHEAFCSRDRIDIRGQGQGSRQAEFHVGWTGRRPVGRVPADTGCPRRWESSGLRWTPAHRREQREFVLGSTRLTGPRADRATARPRTHKTLRSRDLCLYLPGGSAGTIETMTRDLRVNIERASPTDVMELVCDVSGTSMQVAAVLVLDTPTPLDFSTVRQAFAERIIAVPRLRQRLANTPFGCGRPVWIDDPLFDIDQHLNWKACPDPGDEQALLSVVAGTIAARLPTDRPLWSALLITGVAGCRTALVVTFHHVLADGMGGLAILGQLVDGGTSAGVDHAFPRRAPGHRDLLVDALRSRARVLRRLPRGVRRLRAAATELGGGSGKTRAPECSLNVPIGTRRALSVVRADLAAVSTAAHAHDATINDLVVTAATGALAAVLGRRGEDIDRLVVSMPVSARKAASGTALGNQVGVIPVEVPVTGDLFDRLGAVAAVTRDRKTVTPGASAALIDPLFRALAKAGLFRWFIDRQRMVNTFVSNLRGPEQRLHFLGAPVVEVIPIPMITGNITVAFGVLSCAGTLAITVIVDPDHVPDLPDIVEALRQELDALIDVHEQAVAGAASHLPQ